MLSFVEKAKMESSLVPVNSNLAKKKKSRTRKKVTVVDKSNNDAQLFTFKDLDPFKNSPSFVRFYRDIISSKKSEAKFDVFDSDVRVAAAILDRLIETGNDNKAFLIDWIEYYADHKLKGRKATWLKYTVLKAFGETFEEYDKKRLSSNQVV